MEKIEKSTDRNWVVYGVAMKRVVLALLVGQLHGGVHNELLLGVERRCGD